MCVSLPASRLQGSRQDFHSLANQHSPPHPSKPNRQRELCKNKCQASSLAIWGGTGFSGRSVKGWEPSRVRSRGRPNPATAPAAVLAQLLSLPVPFSLLCPSLLFPALSRPRIFSPASHLSRHVLQRQLCQSVLRNL